MTTQPDAPQHVGQVIFDNLLRQQQRGNLPRCRVCGAVPERIDLEGNPGEHVLLFQRCGHRVTA